MVSSTDGSPTSTCWKRRSSAASFSMCSRYSSSVVAPTIRSSPRASIGLSMLPASIAHSPVAPAPTTVCSSSMKVTTWPVGVLDLLEHGLEPLLELAAVLRAGHHGGEVEGDQALAPQRLRDVAGDDALGEPLDDGGLADAGLADQHRVVLGPPRQHLDDAADLGVAPDHRVDVALAGPRGEVDAVLLQGLERAFGIGRRDPGRPAHAIECRRELRLGGTVRLQQVRGLGTGSGDPEQEVLGGQVRVAAGLRPLGRDRQRALEGAGRLRSGDSRAAGARQVRQRRVGGREQGGAGDADRVQQRQRYAVRLLEQGVEQVHRLERGVAGRDRAALGRSDRFLAAGGEVHRAPQERSYGRGVSRRRRRR